MWISKEISMAQCRRGSQGRWGAHHMKDHGHSLVCSPKRSTNICCLPRGMERDSGGERVTNTSKKKVKRNIKVQGNQWNRWMVLRSENGTCVGCAGHGCKDKSFCTLLENHVVISRRSSASMGVDWTSREEECECYNIYRLNEKNGTLICCWRRHQPF